MCSVSEDIGGGGGGHANVRPDVGAVCEAVVVVSQRVNTDQ